MKQQLLPIGIANHRANILRLRASYPGAQILDVTSRAELPWRKFSPFYPHGNIPIPFWPDRTAQSVEGIWQGLKRFENEDCIDEAFFEKATMKGLKRTSRATGTSGRPRGQVVGHQRGSDASTILDYLTARMTLYLPTYRWVLEHILQNELSELCSMAQDSRVILLDFNTNDNVLDLSKPLSHAALIRDYLLGNWPTSACRIEGDQP